MDKLPVGQLPDLQQSNNDDEIMVITNSEYNQLKKEKISDLITDFTSTNENNALTKGTDGKMFVTDFGNASNITEGTLPVSVLPDIPKDLLPAIETSDLPVSGVSADTYAYPSSVTVNAQGQVTAIEEGTPSGANANTDLSNITEAGKEVIRQTAGLGEITEALVDKLNSDHSNDTKPYVVETYRNGTSWYRVWSDGVIEQGGMGVTNTAALAEISLMKPYSAADYSILLQARGGTTSLTGWTVNQYDSVAGWKIDKFSVYAAINMSALTGQVASFFWYTIGK